MSQRVPYPPNRGDKITTYHEVKYLAQQHEVEVFCLADGKKDLANTCGLEDLVDLVRAYPINTAAARIRRHRTPARVHRNGSALRRSR